jgi:hypothetical protein
MFLLRALTSAEPQLRLPVKIHPHPLKFQITTGCIRRRKAVNVSCAGISAEGSRRGSTMQHTFKIAKRYVNRRGGKKARSCPCSRGQNVAVVKQHSEQKVTNAKKCLPLF